MTQLATEVCS